MDAPSTVHADGHRVRFVFDETAVSFGLDNGATLEDVARTLAEFAPRRRGDLVSIDVRLAAADGPCQFVLPFRPPAARHPAALATSA